MAAGDDIGFCRKGGKKERMSWKILNPCYKRIAFENVMEKQTGHRFKLTTGEDPI